MKKTKKQEIGGATGIARAMVGLGFSPDHRCVFFTIKFCKIEPKSPKIESKSLKIAQN
jgi:hypothetical protein